MKKERQSSSRKTRNLWVLGATVISLVVIVLIADGCICPRRRTVVIASDEDVDVVYVQTAPPDLRVEVIPKKPGPKAVWIPGHWQFKGNKYIWVPGHWDKKPRGSGWVAGHWKKRPRGWVWVPGHWR